MAYDYAIDIEYCKGCGLCVTVCPKNVLELAGQGQPQRVFPGIIGHDPRTAFTVQPAAGCALMSQSPLLKKKRPEVDAGMMRCMIHMIILEEKMAKVLMKGNEAIAEAAIRSGCLNYFAYPITPQSEVAEYLVAADARSGGCFSCRARVRLRFPI